MALVSRINGGLRLCAALLCLTLSAQAQNFKDGKLNFTEDGSRYLKINLCNQIWLRHSELNPGSTVNGSPKDNMSDIGIRRSRIQLYGSIAPHTFLYIHFGINNFYAASDRKAGFFLHDALAEYEAIPRYLSLGAGLGGWSGLSRFASSSTTSILGLDLPLYQEATNDVTDQFLRKLEVYAKGKIGKLDYRIALAEPMAIQKSATYISNPAAYNNLSKIANFNTEAPKPQVQAYLQYQFWDEESNLLPYATGTYLGSKRVLNIGAGFLNQQQAMRRLADNGTDTLTSALRLFCIDAFCDAPIPGTRGAAVSAYAAFSDYHFGKDYVRNAAVMNPATGTTQPNILNGAGNGMPIYGTGQHIYLQAGYKFRNNLLGKSGTLLPYASAQYARLQRLKDPMLYVDCGINWLISGHQSKLTLAWQNRPIVAPDNIGEQKVVSRKNAVVLQYQVAF